jgi:hypothetical protein
MMDRFEVRIIHILTFTLRMEEVPPPKGLKIIHKEWI